MNMVTDNWDILLLHCIINLSLVSWVASHFRPETEALICVSTIIIVKPAERDFIMSH